MLEVWTELITLFVTYISYFTDALYNVFNSILQFDIKTFDINLSLFSETPILTISLFNLLNIIIFSIIFIWFFKIIISILMAPINAIKRHLSPRGVIKK